MAAWSAVLRGDGQPHTLLGRVFDALEDRQRGCNFLLVGIEAYPQTPEFQFVNGPSVWLSGEELTQIVRQEDFQWVWGAFLAFSPEISKEWALSNTSALYVPQSSDWDSWQVRNRFLETGAQFMIFADDSTATELLTQDRELVDGFCRQEPQANVTRLERKE